LISIPTVISAGQEQLQTPSLPPVRNKTVAFADEQEKSSPHSSTTLTSEHLKEHNQKMQSKGPTAGDHGDRKRTSKSRLPQMLGESDTDSMSQSESQSSVRLQEAILADESDSESAWSGDDPAENKKHEDVYRAWAHGRQTMEIDSSSLFPSSFTGGNFEAGSPDMYDTQTRSYTHQYASVGDIASSPRHKPNPDGTIPMFSEPLLDMMFKVMDPDGDGLIDLTEFVDSSVNLASRKQIEKLVGENLFTDKMFDVIDRNHNGKIDRKEFFDWARKNWVHEHKAQGSAVSSEIQHNFSHSVPYLFPT